MVPIRGCVTWGPTYDVFANDETGVNEMNGIEIRDLIPPHGVNHTCYAEGVHPNVDILDGTPGAGGFFMFEEDWPTTCRLLQRIGFTATQILEARERYFREEAEDAALDDRPWGEQQGQIDWLESRYDIPGEE